ncbi:hypothetical protein C0J52_10024 [Blattella germanica]|nr:hypothetical protein C0J52_10024 [Blattella germanica]
MEMYGDLDVISFIRLNRLRWVGYVSRMDVNKKVHQVCYTHPEGKRLRGRPKNRWCDLVKDDKKKCKIKKKLVYISKRQRNLEEDIAGDQALS